MFTDIQLQQIFSKTKGHCHFCGDKLNFGRYGLKGRRKVKGTWEADHVIQKAKGGSKSHENCLPACVKCNKLRWHRKGSNLIELIEIGLIGKSEIKTGTKYGKIIKQKLLLRKRDNSKRRRNNG